MSKSKKVIMTNDEINQIVTDESLTTSQKIRELNSLNVPRWDISVLLNKRYQHVRNVLITPLKKT